MKPKWIIFWVAFGMLLVINLICGYLAHQNGDDIYNWINWALFRWIFTASVVALGVLALLIRIL